MDFEIVGPIRDTETIAAGRAIRQLRRLRVDMGVADGGSGREWPPCGSNTVRYTRQRCIGTRLTALDGGSSSSSSRSWTER